MPAIRAETVSRELHAINPRWSCLPAIPNAIHGIRDAKGSVMLRRVSGKMGQRLGPLTLQEAMDALVLARASAFDGALDRAVAAFRDGPLAENPPYFPWSSDLLPQCFAISDLGDHVSGLEFKSDPVLAHRVMCAAALFYRVGWRSLDLAAIRWCKNFLRASLPPKLPSAAAKDLIQARIHIVAMIRGSSASEVS